jgi:hypothetical protein
MLVVKLSSPLTSGNAIRSGSCLIDHNDRAGDREPMISARQAAEALFAPKRQLSGQPAREAGPSSDEPARKPRVLSVSSPAEHPRQEPLAVRQPSAATTPKIPKSQFARIRAWKRYGMSARQVAEVYGVSVGEIDGILRAA